MKTHHRKLLIVGCSVALSALPVLIDSSQAELPPYAYDISRIEAEEVVMIHVDSLETKKNKKETRITLKAKVIGVERSVQNLQVCDTIQISYGIDHPDPQMTGPSAIPILEEGKVYPAFLRKKGNKRFQFSPAAGSSSFIATPKE